MWISFTSSIHCRLYLELLVSLEVQPPESGQEVQENVSSGKWVKIIILRYWVIFCVFLVKQKKKEVRSKKEQHIDHNPDFEKCN